MIFNRTTGSTSPNNPNNRDVLTVTVSASTIVTTTVSSTIAPSNPTAYASLTPSSDESIKVGLGVGLPLGLAFLGLLALLWRQRSRELGARTEAHTWREKYEELREEQRGESTSGEGQVQELHENCRPSEIDGSHFYEMGRDVR